jgi:hypothetical protein
VRTKNRGFLHLHLPPVFCIELHDVTLDFGTQTPLPHPALYICELTADCCSLACLLGGANDDVDNGRENGGKESKAAEQRDNAKPQLGYRGWRDVTVADTAAD